MVDSKENHKFDMRVEGVRKVICIIKKKKKNSESDIHLTVKSKQHRVLQKNP